MRFTVFRHRFFSPNIYLVINIANGWCVYQDSLHKRVSQSSVTNAGVVGRMAFDNANDWKMRKLLITIDISLHISCKFSTLFWFCWTCRGVLNRETAENSNENRQKEINIKFSPNENIMKWTIKSIKSITWI